MPANAGDMGSVFGSGRSLEKEETGNPFQYSCLENPIDRGAWWATGHGVWKEWDMTEQLNNSHRLSCLTVLPNAWRVRERERR